MPLDELLRRLKILAARVSLPELGSWVALELNGYPSATEFPAYRGPFPATVLGDFAGPFGSAVKNAPIPRTNLEPALRGILNQHELFELRIRQSVSEIQDLVADGATIMQDRWAADVIGLINRQIQHGRLTIYEGMGLQVAWKIVTRQALIGVLEGVRNRTLDFLLGLDVLDPAAGEDLRAMDTNQVRQIFHTTIIGAQGSNVAIGGSYIKQVMDLPASRDDDGLLAWLRGQGVTDELLDELRQALAADSKAPSSDLSAPGRHVKEWLARIAVGSGRAASVIGTGATGEMIALAIAHHFGFG